MAVTDYIDIAITHTVAGGLITDKRYFGYDDTVMNCQQATAAVQALTEAQVLALATSAPVAPYRKLWRVTTCGTTGSGETEFQADTDDGPDFIEDSSTGSGTTSNTSLSGLRLNSIVNH